MRIIMPTSDLAFKKVMSSEENKDILSGLIEDFFGIKPEDLTIENPYSIAICAELAEKGQVSKLRETLKDIAATMKSADFTAEIQLRKTLYFDERFLYYPFERYCQNYSREEAMHTNASGKLMRMSSLRPIYALNILGYTHFDDVEALRILELCDQKKNKRLEKEYIRIALFELTKEILDTPNQKHWRDYFLTGNANTNAPDYIKRASQIIQYVNLNKEERRMISMMEKLEEIDLAEKEYRFNEGMVIGKKAGLLEGEKKGLIKGEKKGLIKGEKKGKMEGKKEGLMQGKVEIYSNELKLPPKEIAKKLQIDEKAVLDILKQLVKANKK